MSGPSEARERVMYLGVGNSPGQPHRGQVGQTRSRLRQMPPRRQDCPPIVPQVRSVPDLTMVSQDTTMYASMFEPLNRSLKIFIAKLSKSTERGERSRRTLKKPKSYKGESDSCIDTWIEVMKLHFEAENLSKKQECSSLTSNLEGTSLYWVMVKKANERDSARKILDLLLNCFGFGVQGQHRRIHRQIFGRP